MLIAVNSPSGDQLRMAGQTWMAGRGRLLEETRMPLCIRMLQLRRVEALHDGPTFCSVDRIHLGINLWSLHSQQQETFGRGRGYARCM